MRRRAIEDLIRWKSEENLRSKSLRQFCTDFHPAEALRLSMSDYREESWMTNIPLYAVATPYNL